jgi:outer membrane beta-barrel protein
MAMTKRTAILLGTLFAMVPLAARAELPERKSPLADAPAIRHRVELRSSRFELGAGVTTTIGQDYYHAVLVGGKLSMHLTDWVAISAFGGHNVTPNFKTSFRERLEGTGLPDRKGSDRTPTKAEAFDPMNKIGQAFGAQLELSPFSGKYSLFGKIFASYDFYGFGGLGGINFIADVEACPDGAAMNSCPVTGLKLGANFGLGIHTFLNDFISLNVEFRDILLKNNPAGRDETGDNVADGEDLSWDSNYMVGLNLTLFLPSKAAISD